MSLKPPEECNKGDIWSFEICAERSSPNKDGVTFVLWKNQDDKFKVERYDGVKWIGIGRRTENEAEARKLYEMLCDKSGCSPYPEAAAYYK